MLIKIGIPSILIFSAAMFGCNLDPFGATSNRPAIPIPVLYEGAVPEKSDIMVIDEAPARSFNPLIAAAYDVSGNPLSVPAGSRVLLITSGENELV